MNKLPVNHPAQHHPRNSIALEDGEILSQQAWPEGQYQMRIHAPACARSAQPGSFVHIQCSPQCSPGQGNTAELRRPLSIMRASADEGWIELLYKVVGQGTARLARQTAGTRLSVLGPIGKAFALSPERPRPLLIGGGVGIPPMVFVAEHIHRQQLPYRPLVIMGSEIPFPFLARPSSLEVSGIHATTDAAMPLLESWGIPSRLASLQGYAGTHQGYVTDLARRWLDSLDQNSRKQVEILSCGPTPMLKACAALATEYQLPCQVSLEEYMACAVGGCAGCTVEIRTAKGPAMKRVCVDGPVFDASQVVFG